MLHRFAYWAILSLDKDGEKGFPTKCGKACLTTLPSAELHSSSLSIQCECSWQSQITQQLLHLSHLESLVSKEMDGFEFFEVL